MNIKYSINHGQQLEFWVPGRTQNMRWAAHSVGILFSSCSFGLEDEFGCAYIGLGWKASV